MANAKKCDRCGKYYDDGDSGRVVFGDHRLDGIKTFSTYRGTTGTYDLCGNCAAELAQFMSDGKRGE